MALIESRMQSWTARLDLVRENCSSALPENQLPLFFGALDALAEAPVRFLALTGLDVPRSRIASFLSCEAFDSAAIAMLGRQAVYMLSRGSDDTSIASVILPGMATDVSASAGTESLALLAALLKAVLELDSLQNVITVASMERSAQLH